MIKFESDPLLSEEKFVIGIGLLSFGILRYFEFYGLILYAILILFLPVISRIEIHFE